MAPVRATQLSVQTGAESSAVENESARVSVRRQESGEYCLCVIVFYFCYSIYLVWDLLSIDIQKRIREELKASRPPSSHRDQHHENERVDTVTRHGKGAEAVRQPLPPGQPMPAVGSLGINNRKLGDEHRIAAFRKELRERDPKKKNKFIG